MVLLIGDSAFGRLFLWETLEYESGTKQAVYCMYNIYLRYLAVPLCIILIMITSVMVMR